MTDLLPAPSVQHPSLASALATLPPEQRACWVLQEMHGLSTPEIAYAIGASATTVRGWIARTRMQLATGMPTRQ